MFSFDIFIFNEGRDKLNKEIDGLKELHETIINDWHNILTIRDRAPM